MNRPVYFSEFVDHAGAHGLKFLASAYFRSPDNGVPPAVEGILAGLAPDRLRREQYLDWFTGAAFRRLLLVADDQPIDEAPSAPRVVGLTARLRARPIREAPDVASDAPEEFRSPLGDSLTTSSPRVKAVLTALFEAGPAGLDVAEIDSALAAKLGPVATEDRPTTTEILLASARSNLISLHAHRPEVVATAGPTPRAVAWARIQLESGSDATNAYHEQIELGDFDRRALLLADGRTPRSEIAPKLAEEGQARADEAEMLLDEALGRLAGAAFLTG